MHAVLDNKYENSDLNKFIKDQLKNLTEDQKKYLLNLFQNFEDLLDGTLDTRKTDPLYFELKEYSKLICL